MYCLDTAKQQPCLYEWHIKKDKDNSGNVYISVVYRRGYNLILHSRYNLCNMNALLSVKSLSSGEERRFIGSGVPSSSAPVGIK